MPEGPETRSFVDSINRFFNGGAEVHGLQVVSGRYTKKPIEGLANVSFPLTVESVSCKGKFIYWTFKGTQVVLFNTLGMSGSWSNVPRHSRVKVLTSSGDLFFNDPRNFGTLKFCDRKSLAKKLATLGPDMLNEEVTPETFVAHMMKVPGSTLAEALMNQGVVSGVGNYLKSDSLWLAKLSPHRRVEECSEDQLIALCKSVRSVITTAYNNGGSTILTYKGFDGEEGRHEMLVYGCKTDPDGNEVVSENTKDGRTTWWVPQVQK